MEADGGEDWKPEGWLKRQGKGVFGKKFIKKYFVVGGGMLLQYKAADRKKQEAEFNLKTLHGHVTGMQAQLLHLTEAVEEIRKAQVKER